MNKKKKIPFYFYIKKKELKKNYMQIATRHCLQG